MRTESLGIAASGAESRATERIIEQLNFELLRRRSRLASDARLDLDFERQTRRILEETFVQLRDLSPDLPPLVTVEYGTPAEMLETARVRADQDIHPAEPLMAAEALFGVALPLVVEVVQERTAGADIVAIARTLHHAVWRRFPPGAIHYVEILRTRLSNAHQESRRRISLELHDRIAHGIATGIQRVELSRMGSGSGPVGQNRELDRAITIFRSALADVQDLALALRQRVGDRSIDMALREYIANSCTMKPETRFTVEGESMKLSESIAEEAFTIVLEAIRNSRTHAVGASFIDVHVRWALWGLSIDVTDDGQGFDPNVVRSRSIGLIGMQERSEAIGARLSVVVSGKGTTVSLVLLVGPTESE